MFVHCYTNCHISGIPDAPVDVQVEAGPQDGSLLVTWLPVTINTSGTSNGASVTGYVVFTDGHRVKEILSPTGRAKVITAKNHSLPKYLLQTSLM